MGPFAVPTRLRVDPEVTVLTGPNDTGKSLALRLVHLLCTKEAATERDINSDRIGEFDGPWKDDPEITCVAVFDLTESAIKNAGLTGNCEPGDELTVRVRLNQDGHPLEVVNLKRGSKGTRPSLKIRRWPRILNLPLESSIKEVIDFSKMTEAEKAFVCLGFGKEFSLEQHKALKDVTRSFRIAKAETELNLRLHQLFPLNMAYKFSLREISAKSELLGVALVDGNQGHSPIESRGEGVQKLVGVMGSLMAIDASDGHTYVLFDEPESSLHADAQHALRFVLEELAKRPNIQVIYATHSPAMINTMRPSSIRVLKRERKNDKATTTFVNQAYAENFVTVRSSLGMTPSDSLLYAPVTVVVEGPTEVRCLPVLFQRLSEAGVDGFQAVELILPQTHLLDGCGSSYEYMCRLAKSQNAKPVVLLDGDKQNELGRLQQDHPEVPVVFLPSGEEFENVVPKAAYIAAAAAVLEDDSGKMTLENFEQWEASASLRPSVLFSKRVERWLRDEYDKPLYKPLVMEKAIHDSDANSINIEPFRRLVEHMTALLPV